MEVAVIEGQFSRTAISAAGLRAAHQLVDGASVFADPLAARILGKDLFAVLADTGHPALLPLRVFIALRSRIAEDAARRAVEEGARQIVVLGAGLDTLGYRLAPLEGLSVFEVDHPATQNEKRRRLAATGIAIPAHLVFAPCDFEAENLAGALSAAGFVENRRAVFIGLGVIPYLTPEAAESLLRYVAALSDGAEIVFDYANPPHSIDGATRVFHEQMAARAATLGETFRCYFDTQDLHKRLAALGFDEVDDWGPRRIRERFAPNSPPAAENGGHILRAARTSCPSHALPL
jgi:methyltransferase (TIGR00027 family)